MELTLDKLVKFDLVKDIEQSLFKEEGQLDHFVKLTSIYNDIEKIDEFIKDSPSFPGSTDKIIRSELVSVVGATLAIEGINLAQDEIVETFEKAALQQNLGRKEQEAENSRKVYQFIRDLDLEQIKKDEGKFVYTEQIIKQIHKYFTEDMNYLSNTPGQYRGNFTPSFGHPRKESLCRTTSEVETAMSNFVTWLNEDRFSVLSGFRLIKAIMAHYYLTEIHPFGDGNGRTGRAVEALILFVNGINQYCFWSLANFWSADTNQYLAHLDNIRHTCDPYYFLIWGMEGYRDEVRKIKIKVLKKVKQLMFLDYSNYLLKYKKGRKIKINQRIITLLGLLVNIEKLPLAKFLSSPEVSAIYHNLTPSTKSRDFGKMDYYKLIKINKENGQEYIEPNFQILDIVKYNI